MTVAAPAKTITRLNDLAQGKLDGPKIDPRTIVIREKFNMRDMDSDRVRAHIEWLKSSILTNHLAGRDGLDKPLQVEWADKTPYLVDGQCRLTALLELWAAGNNV